MDLPIGVDTLNDMDRVLLVRGMSRLRLWYVSRHTSLIITHEINYLEPKNIHVVVECKDEAPYIEPPIIRNCI